MITTTTISPSVWIVWAIIGIVGGYMTGRLVADGVATWVSLIAGIAAACLGGWLFTRFVGTTDNDIYLSLVVSAAVTAIVLWIVTLIARRRGGGRDDGD